MMAMASAPEARCPAATEFQPLRNQSTPANFRIALTTPISAPPAMKPEAISVPFSWRAEFTASSLLRLLTYQLMAPPTSRGRLRSRGMNMPRQKARAGTLNTVRRMAIAAPIP